MPLRRDDPAFWEWFMERYAYSMQEAAWMPAEFLKTDELFDVWTWEMWMEARRQEYDRYLAGT
jgi:hypothetical protein